MEDKSKKVAESDKLGREGGVYVLVVALNGKCAEVLDCYGMASVWIFSKKYNRNIRYLCGSKI